MNRLMEAYKDYIELLENELDEVCPVAAVHGWKSDRVEKGYELRARIKELESECIEEDRPIDYL